MPTKRILLLEDDLLVAEMLAYVLVDEGYIVDRATTQAEAERRLALAQYDLVIADWRLPDGDGTVIADMAAHLGSKTFLMSGYLSEMPGGRSMEHETLMKPIRPSEIVAAVNRRIGRSRQL